MQFGLVERFLYRQEAPGLISGTSTLPGFSWLSSSQAAAVGIEDGAVASEVDLEAVG